MVDLQEMAQYLYEEMQKGIPYDKSPNYIRNVKHKGRNEHIRNVAITNAIPLGSTGNYVFDIGNDYAEMNYPYYHILEDAEVIHKRDRGTPSSKGSQNAYSPIMKNRDYGKWSGSKNQKINKNTGEVTFSKSVYQEYRKNVRGSRSRVGSATDYRYMGVFIVDGKTKYSVRNSKSNLYVNRHYHYIERTLDTLVDTFATQFGLKRKRTQIDLSEEMKEVFGE